jgi:hypothetical protein
MVVTRLTQLENGLTKMKNSVREEHLLHLEFVLYLHANVNCLVAALNVNVSVPSTRYGKYLR